MKLTAFLFLTILPSFAGQSLQMFGSVAATNSYPVVSHSLPSRVGFYLHDWSTSGNNLYIASSDAFGFQSIIYNPGPGNLQIAVFSNWETDPVGFESSVKEIE